MKFGNFVSYKKWQFEDAETDVVSSCSTGKGCSWPGNTGQADVPMQSHTHILTLYPVSWYSQVYHVFTEANHLAGEVLVFYLPIRFFYYLANLIIFTRSSRIPCIFFLEGGFKGIYLREKNFTLSYVVSEI